MKSLYLVVHPKRRDDEALLRSLFASFEREGFRVLPEGEEEDACAVVAVGGDGTLLRANQTAVRLRLPLLGINLGRVGFLSEVELDQVATAAKRLHSGDYTVEERMMLSVRYSAGKEALALNDAVVSRGDSARLTSIMASVGDDLIGRYIADGVIVSSPTGSTAYSLSAGGPIVSPKVSCMVLCPICAHSLQHRPVVVSGEDTITLKLDGSRDEDMRLSIDGQIASSLRGDEVITIRRAEQTARFIRFDSQGFFGLVRRKLSEWSC